MLAAEASILQHLHGSDLDSALVVMQASPVCALRPRQVVVPHVSHPLHVHVQGLSLRTIADVLQVGDQIVTELDALVDGRARLEPLQRQLMAIVSSLPVSCLTMVHAWLHA